MKYLLDTSTYIWFTDGDAQLSTTAKDQIEDEESELFISIVTLWEIVIKQRLNKLDFSSDVTQMLADIQTLDATLLGIEPRHLQSLETLPAISDHKDPFDRLLLSQAIADELIIISSDRHFPSYPVQVQW